MKLLGKFILKELQSIDRKKIAALILVVVWNGLVYWGARTIAGGWYHTNIESRLDQMIPLLPWTVSIYFGCYIFWGVNYILGVCTEEKTAYRFACSDLIGKTICLIIFLAFPTTNTRPEIVGTGIWNDLMRLLYSMDAADNLFPSIHCYVSWMCFIGVRGRKDIPGWYKWISAFLAIAVFISVLTTKQHVIADVVSGLLLAELSWLTAGFAVSAFYRKKGKRKGIVQE